MQLVRDVPGQRLLLEDVSENSVRWLAGKCLLALGSAFVVVLELFEAEAWAWIGTRLGAGGAVVLFLLLWFGLVGVLVVASARAVHRVVRLAAERANGDLYVEASGLFGRRRLRVAVPLENIDGLIVRASTTDPASAHTPLSFHLEMRARVQGKPRRVKFQFSVEHVDHWEEALDFSFRLARVIGLTHHCVKSGVPKSLSIEFSRDARDGFSAVPEIRTEADYASNEVEAHATLKEDPPPPFSPSTFSTFWQVAEWRPGQRVRFLAPREWFSPQLFIALLVFVTALAMLASTYRWKGSESDRVLVTVLGGGALVVGIVGAVLAVAFHRREQVELDFVHRIVRMQRTWSRLEVPFSAAREMEIRLVCPREERKPSVRAFCQVLLRVDAGGRGATTGELLIEGSPVEGNPKAVFDTARSMGMELARALGVPLRCARRVKSLLEPGRPVRSELESPLK